MRHRAATLLLVFALCLGAAGAENAARAAGVTTDQAVAYQINAAHTGSVSGDALAIPLSKRWSVNLGGGVSYPLIAGGKIFVTVPATTQVNGLSHNAATLYALDQATGATAWSVTVPSTYPWSAAAYDAGAVFLVTTDGTLSAYKADSGVQLWAVRLPVQYAFSSPPTASGGVVYLGGAGSGGTLYAVNEMDGSVLWSQAVMNGDHSSPAVDGSGVYVSYAGPQVYGFNLAGAQLWHYNSGFEGGGGTTPALFGGKLWARTPGAAQPAGTVFDSATGALLSTFSAGPIPAFSGTTALFETNGTLVAQSVTDGSTLWSFSAAGKTLVSAPVVANSTVFEGASDGTLYALDLVTGQIVWSGNVGSGISAPDEHNVSQPLTGLGVGEGFLAVPAGNSLVVFSSSPPSVSPVSFSGTEGAAFSGPVATFTDADQNAGSDTASISWGDGTASTAGTVTFANGTYTVGGTHTYAEGGTYTVRVSVTNRWGTAAASSSAAVSDAALTASAGTTLSVTAGTSVAGRLGGFSDSNPLCPLSDFGATVAWGDGSPSSAATVAAGASQCAFDLSGSHLFAVPGTYTVSTSVVDAGGATVVVTGTAGVTTPAATSKTSVSASNSTGGFSVSLSAATKNGSPSGSLRFSTSGITIVSTRITSVVHTGANTSTVYGTGTQNGSAVNFAASVLGNQSSGKNTFQIQTNTGYSSGTISISSAQVR